MRQHPIPQNISAFEFKLVGFLTLKQFLYLAGVGILSFVIFVSTASFLKFVFITPLILLGLALAFFPINGMPFDKWIVVFLRAITTPSKRVWRKEPKVISFLEPQFSYYLRRPSSKAPEKTADRGQLEALVAQIKAAKQKNKLDRDEQTRLGTLDFNQPTEGQTPTPSQSMKIAASNEKPHEKSGANNKKSSFFSLAHLKKGVV